MYDFWPSIKECLWEHCDGNDAAEGFYEVRQRSHEFDQKKLSSQRIRIIFAYFKVVRRGLEPHERGHVRRF